MPPITLILGPKIRCIVTQVTATQNGRSAWLRQEKLGPESVGRLSILCNHSLSRSKLLKQLRFLFFQRARGSRWKSGCSSFEARQRVAARATELGIPQHFQPSLHVYWLSRGRDGLKKIRAAL